MCEQHLDVFQNRSELHLTDGVSVFQEGKQGAAAQRRYGVIRDALENGFLDQLLLDLAGEDFQQLNPAYKRLVDDLINGVTSEVGRALVAVGFLQLTIKSICPDQNIRLHKGSSRDGTFSWTEGISMRTLDATYTTPFLRKHDLLKLNAFGAFMTRSLAENYPYSILYKAEMRGPFQQWIRLVDSIESDGFPAKHVLCYLIACLKNKSESFLHLADQLMRTVQSINPSLLSLVQVQELLLHFVRTTSYSARAFEVVIHGLFQAMEELGLLDGLSLVPLSQMRSANKKHGNVGDVELQSIYGIEEAWDAKFGKPYLRDELGELEDKLQESPSVRVAGFIVDGDVSWDADMRQKVSDIQGVLRVEIQLLSFKQWVAHVTSGVDESLQLGYHWLNATAGSFAQKRRELAPLDEPCDKWVSDLTTCLHRVLSDS